MYWYHILFVHEVVAYFDHFHFGIVKNIVLCPVFLCGFMFSFLEIRASSCDHCAASLRQSQNVPNFQWCKGDQVVCLTDIPFAEGTQSKGVCSSCQLGNQIAPFSKIFTYKKNRHQKNVSFLSLLFLLRFFLKKYSLLLLHNYPRSHPLLSSCFPHLPHPTPPFTLHKG